MPAPVETLYWYDLETTGIRPGHDRVLQFAGVRTDTDLNIIDTPQNVYCQLSDEILPSPEALMVTGIRLSRLAADGLSEREFAQTIFKQFSQPGTCVVGYNNLRFDDEFVRNLFYRNFLDPYVREWKNGNSRWDVIDVVRMAYALRPEGIRFGRNADGGPVFKLESLSTANGITHDDAHDAVSDVMATVQLTRLIRQAQPRLYDYLFGLRRKDAVLQTLYPLGKQPLVHVSSMYPNARGCAALVVALCQHPEVSNGVLCYDLMEDPEPLMTLDPATLRRRLFTRRDELGEDEPRLRVKTIRVNKCPAIAPAGTMTREIGARLGIDVDQCMGNFKRLQRASGVVERLQEAVGGREFAPRTDPDLMLYDGFFDDQERALMNQVGGMDGGALAESTMPFRDQRLPELLFRYRARNFRESLSQREVQRWNVFRRERWHDGADIAETRAQIASLPESPVLQDLRAHLDRIEGEVF